MMIMIMISREPTVTRPALDSACLLPIRQQQKRQGADFFFGIVKIKGMGRCQKGCGNKVGQYGIIPSKLSPPPCICILSLRALCISVFVLHAMYLFVGRRLESALTPNDSV